MTRFLKLTAFVLAAALVFGACNGDDETPIETDTPPPATPTQPGPEPTSPPDNGTPPPTSDPSAWTSYTSPLGITFSYPPDWIFVGTFDDFGQPDPDGTHALVQNVVGTNTAEPVVRAEILIESNSFDPERLERKCITPPTAVFAGGPDTIEPVTIQGRDALLCEAHNLTANSLESYAFTLWIQMEDGRVVEVSAGGEETTDERLAIARAIIDSVVLE